MDHLEPHEAHERLPLSDFQRAILREVERRLRHAEGSEVDRVDVVIYSQRDIAVGNSPACLIEEVASFSWPPRPEDVKLAEDDR